MISEKMGRQRYSDRQLVEDCKVLSVQDLKRDGKLYDLENRWRKQWHLTLEGVYDPIIPPPQVEITYGLPTRYGEPLWKSLNVELSSTPCHFGGKRWWMKCDCGRRVQKLYIPPREVYYSCRKCHDLTYKLQKEHTSNLMAWQKACDYEVKLCEIGKGIKRTCYAGKPTRKFRQYLKYKEKYDAIYPIAISQLKNLNL